MNCYVYVIVRQCILYCISFELPCINIYTIKQVNKNILYRESCWYIGLTNGGDF